MSQTGDVRFQTHDELVRRLEEAETWENMRREQVKKLVETLKQACDDIDTMLAVSPQTLLKIEAERNIRHYRAVLKDYP